MKKILVVGLLFTAFIFEFCSTSKKTSSVKTPKEPSKITYIANVQPIIAASCTPCHIPPNGTKKFYNTYAPVKSDIDDIIARIQKNPGDRGFMPAKHPKLSDSVVHVFIQWKADGLVEN